MIKFRLDGCDIAFTAEAPEDITLKELLVQCDRIIPDWCACGICSARENDKVELRFEYDNVIKVDESAPCRIKDKEVKNGNN